MLSIIENGLSFPIHFLIIFLMIYCIFNLEFFIAYEVKVCVYLLFFILILSLPNNVDDSFLQYLTLDRSDVNNYMCLWISV